MRDHYEFKDAMFVNSLFKDFLEVNGLASYKGKSTKDIICVEFNYGSRSYQDELTHLHKIALVAKNEYNRAKSLKDTYLMNKALEKRNKITELLRQAYNNKNKYIELSKDELRKYYYNNGISVEYLTYNKAGEIKKQEIVHYKMLYRSTNKAKKGTCMFIRDGLYDKAIDYLYMGIKLPKDNAPIVEISAYAPLISSGIVGKIQIDPKEILVLKDVDRYFETNIISIETDEQKHCLAKHINNYKLKNAMFDGQALIDSSIFPSWGNGYVLLRQHFCKMAAFNTNIQQFFKDYFGDNYSSATVTDMWGNEHYVKDIKLITTDNAMKWIKFDITYDYWCNKVYENDCLFGVVKTAHESKLGNVQRMSYQMVNSLDTSIMENVLKETVDYLISLKTDDKVFLDYLEKNKNFSKDYEALLFLSQKNPEFVRSSYFRERRRKIIKDYLINVKSGKIIQNAENLTIVGSPYAMLLYAASGNEYDVDKDETFCIERNSIQCFTKRFKDNEYLAFFRSPFNSKNNLTYLHNVYNPIMDKYFNFGNQIIAVNMNGTDFQDRNNGADQDSDFGYTTNQPDIVRHAKMCYMNYPTIVNNIPKEKNVYTSSMDDFAKLDNNLSASQTDIGESSNLAQIAQTYACNFQDTKYQDYVCILSVLAQVAIDNSKRRFDIDLTQEIKAIKKDMDIKNSKYPIFWCLIKHGFNKSNINTELKCPMNYLYDLKVKEYHSPEVTLPMSYFFEKYELDMNRHTSKKVEEIISKYSLNLFNYNIDKTDNQSNDIQDEYLLLKSDFEDMVSEIQKINISNNYLGLMSWLIDRAFFINPSIKQNTNTLKSTISKNRSLLIKVLFDVNKNNLLKCFSKNL